MKNLLLFSIIIWFTCGYSYFSYQHWYYKEKNKKTKIDTTFSNVIYKTKVFLYPQMKYKGTEYSRSIEIETEKPFSYNYSSTWEEKNKLEDFKDYKKSKVVEDTAYYEDIQESLKRYKDETIEESYEGKALTIINSFQDRLFPIEEKQYYSKCNCSFYFEKTIGKQYDK